MSGTLIRLRSDLQYLKNIRYGIGGKCRSNEIPDQALFSHVRRQEDSRRFLRIFKEYRQLVFPVVRIILCLLLAYTILTDWIGHVYSGTAQVLVVVRNVVREIVIFCRGSTVSVFLGFSEDRRIA
jgi:hypothetical protein